MDVLWHVYLISLGVCAFNTISVLAHYAETGEERISAALVPGLAGFAVFPFINTALAVISTVIIFRNGGYIK